MTRAFECKVERFDCELDRSDPNDDEESLVGHLV
jgi:hypothetical protein